MPPTIAFAADAPGCRVIPMATRRIYDELAGYCPGAPERRARKADAAPDDALALAVSAPDHRNVAKKPRPGGGCRGSSDRGASVA
jgi:hypothetical protein